MVAHYYYCSDAFDQTRVARSRRYAGHAHNHRRHRSSRVQSRSVGAHQTQASGRRQHAGTHVETLRDSSMAATLLAALGYGTRW